MTRVTAECKVKRVTRENEDLMDLKVILASRGNEGMLDLRDRSDWRDPKDLR